MNNSIYGFSEDKIVDEYYELANQAYVLEQKWMHTLQERLKAGGKISSTDPLITTDDPDTFFDLLLNQQNYSSTTTPTILAPSYQILHNGTQISSTTIKNNTQINEYLKQGKYANAAGLLFESAGKDITQHIVNNLFTNTQQHGLTAGTLIGQLSDPYYGDYTIEVYDVGPPANGYQAYYILKSQIPIEEKARLDVFHVANPKNKGILSNLTDVYSYMKPSGMASIYDYLTLKLVKEKIKDYYPIFRSTNASRGARGVLTSSTMLIKPGNFELRGKKYPSRQDIHNLAINIASTLDFGPHKLLAEEAGTYMAKQQLGQDIFKNVLKQAAKNKGISNISLWYINK